MDIRILTAEDAAEFSRLRLEALEKDSPAFGSTAREHRALDAAALAERLRASPPDKFVVGAYDSGVLAGMAGFRRDESDKGRHRGMLWGVYVTPSARGKGMARQLITAVIERVSSSPDIEQITLTVSAPQVGAKALYESLGFKSWGLEPRPLKLGLGQYVDEYHMILHLR
jgi:RimJ/RimL family protein N-acetyltransferase